MNIEFEEYKFATPFYALSVALRDKVLRKPLGLEFSEVELLKEWNDIHIGAFNNDELCACLVLSPLGEGRIKMRQVAVHPGMQGRGIGSKLVEFSESLLKSMGYLCVELNARDTAIDFYKQKSYLTEGEEFVEVGIVHIKMTKQLN